jgi:hypothetical protein
MMSEYKTLNNAEQWLTKALAKARMASNKQAGVTERKLCDQAPEEINLNGIGAEIAFCKELNIYPDISVEQPGDFHIADATLPDGRTVDVKTTKYDAGLLYSVKWKTTKVDLFALVVGEFPTYRVVGMMESTELLRPDRLVDLGFGEGFGAKQEELGSVYRSKKEHKMLVSFGLVLGPHHLLEDKWDELTRNCGDILSVPEQPEPNQQQE